MRENETMQNNAGKMPKNADRVIPPAFKQILIFYSKIDKSLSIPDQERPCGAARSALIVAQLTATWLIVATTNISLTTHNTKPSQKNDIGHFRRYEDLLYVTNQLKIIVKQKIKQR